MRCLYLQSESRVVVEGADVDRKSRVVKREKKRETRFRKFSHFSLYVVKSTL